MPTIVNYINLQNASQFSYHNSVKKEVDFKNKKSRIGARLHYKDLISHSFKIADNIPTHELLIKIELKMYEDIGLDPTKTYQISHIQKSRVSDNEVLIEAFTVDKNAITKKYQDALKGIKHVDFLAIPFLSFQTLYKNNILVPKNDIFIYIAEDEAFTTSYQEGRYISSKRLKSLTRMVSELNKKDISITIEELKNILATKGLDREKYDILEYDICDYLLDTFEELFSKIKNLSLHNRNVYNFTQIDRIFLTCDGKPIPALISQVSKYVEDAQFENLDFLQTKTVNTLDAIAASYIKDKLLEDDNDHNMTLFEKKEPYYKSEVGKFTLVAAASALLMSAYPAYLYLQIDTKSKETKLLKSQASIKSNSSNKLKTKLKKLNKEIAKVEKSKAEDFKKLQTLQSIANSLVELKSKDTQYTAMFLKINKILKNYSLSIEKITQVDEHALNLELSSTENRRDTIALLMQDLLSSGFSSVTSGEITREDDIYKSIVRVQR